MENIIDKIQSKLLEIHPKLDEEHQRVLLAIWNRWQFKQKITQAEIAKEAIGIGHHEKHEEPTKKKETTLRKVRQIIRDLRIEHQVPILSDKHGYWIPCTLTECSEYLERIEALARAQAAAWFETYRAMESTVGIRSEFFDKQESLQI